MMTLTPYICCRGAAQAIGFYERAFGARELYRLAEADGKIGHAELSFDGALLYLADEYPDYGCTAPRPDAGSAVTLHLAVPDVDAFIQRAAKEGATIQRPPKDEFYGYRSATVLDPFGHRWTVSTKKEDLSVDEITRRYRELTQHSGAGS